MENAFLKYVIYSALRRCVVINWYHAPEKCTKSYGCFEVDFYRIKQELTELKESNLG